jgi:hypothetical protein
MNQRTAADLDLDSLLGLLGRDDPVGVLSIFADAAPGTRGAEIDLRNRLTELVHRVRDDGASGLADKLERLGDEIPALVDPAGGGQACERARVGPARGQRW